MHALQIQRKNQKPKKKGSADKSETGRRCWGSLNNGIFKTCFTIREPCDRKHIIIASLYWKKENH